MQRVSLKPIQNIKWRPITIKPSTLLTQLLKYGAPQVVKRAGDSAPIKLWTLYRISAGYSFRAVSYRVQDGSTNYLHPRKVISILKEFVKEVSLGSNEWRNMWRPLMCDETTKDWT